MKRLLEIAIEEIGHEEEPRGSNWGIHVKKYLNSVGIRFPASWCMAFVYWCFEKYYAEQSKKCPLYRTGGVLLFYNKTFANNKFSKPAPGDIFIMDYGKGLGHTGIVEKVDGDTIHTIEGNTNDSGSREGYEVCRRQRSISKCVGFVRFA